MEPPILIQASVPGTLTKPAPYKLQGFAWPVGVGFAVTGGGDNFVWGFGLVKVCATTSEATAAASMAVAATTAPRRIARAAALAIQ
jgi:hypothetical protein